MHLSPPPPPPPPGGLGCFLFESGGPVVADHLFNAFPIVCGGSVFVFVLVCTTVRPFQLCNHLEKEEKELVALLLLSCGCLVL